MHSRIALLLLLVTMAGGCADSTPVAPLNQQASPQSPTPPTAPTQPTTPASTSVLKGSYDLTLQMPSACIAERERTRTYSVDIQPSASGVDIVTLAGTRFLTGSICTAGSGRFAEVGCHQFFAATAGDDVSFSLENNNDEAHGGHIVEQLSDGSWVEIIGSASGKLGQPAITASGTASVWYCRESRGYPFPCQDFTGCSTDLRLTLTPR